MGSASRNLLSRRLLARNAVLNLTGSLAPLLVALVVIPVLVSKLGAERFGLLSLIWMLVGYFSLFDLGLGKAVTKLVAEKIGGRHEKEIPPLVWTAMILMGLLSLLGTAMLFGGSSTMVSRFLKVSPALERETVLSCYIIAAILPFLINTSALRGILIAYQRFGLVNAIRIPQGIANFLAPLAVLPFTNSLVAVVASLAVLRMAVWLAHAWVCFRSYPRLFSKVSFQKQLARPLLHFGGWMTVTNIVSPLMTYLDRFFIAAFISATAVAYYAAPYQIVSRLAIFPGAILSVLFPAFTLALESDPGHAHRLFANSIQAILSLLFPVIAFIFLFAHEGLSMWLDETFASNSTLVLQILAVGMLVNCLAFVPFTFLQSAGRPDLTAKFHLLELPFYITALMLVQPHYGIVGTAAVWTGRVVLDACLLFGALFRLSKENGVFLRRLLLVLVLLLPGLFVGLLLQHTLDKCFFLSGLLLWLAVVVYRVLLDAGEKQRIRRVIWSWKRNYL